MTTHNLTNRQYLEQRASMSQWRVWDAHCGATERLFEGKPDIAANWQAEQAIHSDYAIAGYDNIVRRAAECAAEIDSFDGRSKFRNGPQ